MKQSSSHLFSGLIFWGSEFLPRDVTLSIDEIRQWALEEELMWDFEAQLITPETVAELSKHFEPEDQLFILIHLYTEPSGSLTYMEYPYLPVKSLIKQGKWVEIVYWEMMPSVWGPKGNIREYGEVRFGFWYPNIADELSSSTKAKLIVKHFHKLYYDQSMHFERETTDNGVLSVGVNGDIKARFFKSGRFFDVEFS